MESGKLRKQLEEMSIYCNEVEHNLQLKEYEINGIKDQVGYLEGQIHAKEQEMKEETQKLQLTITRLQTESASRPPATNPLQEDFEERIKEYVKAVQSKNQEIRDLDERIVNTEATVRKLTLERSALNHEWEDRLEEIEKNYRRKLGER